MLSVTALQLSLFLSLSCAARSRSLWLCLVYMSCLYVADSAALHVSLPTPPHPPLTPLAPPHCPLYFSLTSLSFFPSMFYLPHLCRLVTGAVTNHPRSLSRPVSVCLFHSHFPDSHSPLSYSRWASLSRIHPSSSSAKRGGQLLACVKSTADERTRAHKRVKPFAAPPHPALLINMTRSDGLHTPARTSLPPHLFPFARWTEVV